MNLFRTDVTNLKGAGRMISLAQREQSVTNTKNKIKDKIISGGKKMKKVTGLNVDEAIAKLGLVDEIKEEKKEIEEVKEEKSIMADIAAAVGGKTTEHVDDIISGRIKGLLVTNNTVNSAVDIEELSTEPLLRKLIVGILNKMHYEFLLVGYRNEDLKNILKAFINALNTKASTFKILPAGKVEFYIGAEKNCEFNIPGIMKTDELVMISTGDVIISEDDAVINHLAKVITR